jgi:hypothetical protein
MEAKIGEIFPSGDVAVDLDKCKIRIRLLGEIEENKWSADDGSGECFLHVPTDVTSRQKVLFKTGNYIKIFRPIKINGGALSLTSRSIVCPTQSFECFQSTLLPEETATNTTTLRNLQGAEPGKKVTSIEIKVIKKLAKNPKFEVTAIIIKDISGAKGNLSLWKELVGQVEIGETYKITNILVKSYPDNPPHYLTSTKMTSIAQINSPELADISPYDILGTVIGITDAYHYTR